MNLNMSRQEIAEELAKRDGAAYELLPERLQKAYLHNADCAIVEMKQEAAPAPAPVEDTLGLSETKEKPAGSILDAVPVARAARKGEYFCIKCNQLHREDSKIGQRHLKFKKPEEK